MADRLDRAYHQLRSELFGDQGHRRGSFVATATPAFDHLTTWMTALAAITPAEHNDTPTTS